MEKVELEIKANYIVLHSVAWGLCDEAYFLNFQKTSKINQLPCFMVSYHFDTTKWSPLKSQQSGYNIIWPCLS